MPTRPAQIVHIVGPDTPYERWLVLRALLAAEDTLGPQAVIDGGARTPLRNYGLEARTRGRDLAERSAAVNCDPNNWVSHIWSPDVAHDQFPARLDTNPWIIDAALVDGRVPAADGPVNGPCIFAAATEAARRTTIAAGIDDDDCVVIPEGFDAWTPAGVRRAELRAQFDYADDDRVCLLLPPFSRHSGAAQAAWGVMIAERICPQLRIVLPAVGREATRIEELVRTSGHRHMLARVGRRYPLEDLIALSDLALQTPTLRTDGTALALACAAALPILGSVQTPLADWGVNTDDLILQPQRVDRIAVSVLTMIENWDETNQHAREFQQRYVRQRSAATMIAAYAQLYKTARARRTPIDGPV